VLCHFSYAAPFQMHSQGCQLLAPCTYVQVAGIAWAAPETLWPRAKSSRSRHVWSVQFRLATGLWGPPSLLSNGYRR
jgi:hypothetical protein